MVETVCCCYRLPTADARPRGSILGHSVLRFVMDKVAQEWVLLSFQVLRFLHVSTHFHLNAVTCVTGRTSGLSFVNLQTKAVLFGMIEDWKESCLDIVLVAKGLNELQICNILVC